MKKCWWSVLFAIAICASAQENSSPVLHPFTVIRAGTLIDGKSDAPRHDQVIILRGNRIESISDAASAKIPDDANVIDLSHATVLPGLIDSHTHIFLQGEEPAQGGYDVRISSSIRWPCVRLGQPFPCGARWNKVSPRCAISRPKARAMATLASKKLSRADTFPVHAC